MNTQSLLIETIDAIPFDIVRVELMQDFAEVESEPIEFDEFELIEN